MKTELKKQAELIIDVCNAKVFAQQILDPILSFGNNGIGLTKMFINRAENKIKLEIFKVTDKERYFKFMGKIYDAAAKWNASHNMFEEVAKIMEDTICGEAQNKTTKCGELTKRRFHAEVRKLKAVCEQEGWELSHYDLSRPDWVCVLSESDYELESDMYECSENNENYFLSPKEYNQYKEKYA